MGVKNHYIEFRNALTKNDVQKAEEEFEKAYNEAFIYLQQKLANNEKFDLNNEEEKYALITLTDNLIGMWKEGMIDDAVPLSESLVELVESPKLKEMFKGYSIGMQSGIDVNTFFREYLDLSKVDAEFPEFLCNFTEKIQELVK